jgi:hypothetical protein
MKRSGTPLKNSRRIVLGGALLAAFGFGVSLIPTAAQTPHAASVQAAPSLQIAGDGVEGHGGKNPPPSGGKRSIA